MSLKNHKDRDSQFKNIAKKRKKYEKEGNPVISADSKKKEKIGNFYREGHIHSVDRKKVLDHDYNHYADALVSPYSIYDILNNECLVNLSTSPETAELACDTIKLWWDQRGKYLYPNASSILLLIDGGGGNSSRSHLFKENLQKIVNRIGLPIEVAHFPPYASKWNPIEHKVFPHITRSMSGVVLKSVEQMKGLIKKTTTKQGLKVFARIPKKIYETGKKVSDDFYEKKANIKKDDFLGAWNYAVNPV